MEPSSPEPLLSEAFSTGDSDDHAELRSLARALDRRRGFKLFFACCNDPTRREEITAELSSARSAGQPEARSIYLRRGESVANLAAFLERELAATSAPGGVFVDGIENVLPEAREAGRSAFVANLNAYRNALPRAVPCPLVLWVTDWLLGVLARNAPDFFSVKSGVYFFAETPRTPLQPSRQTSAAGPQLGWENVPRDKLRARAAEIRALLDSPREATAENRLLEARLAKRLGDLYETLYQLSDAEAAYSRSLALLSEVTQGGSEEGDGGLLASTYHQLGMVAEERRDLAAAEAWYQKALEIKERQGNEHGAALTYHQLGRIAQERRDLTAAEAWYQKALEITERQGDEHGAASAYNQLGLLEKVRGNYEQAGRWLIKSFVALVNTHDQFTAGTPFSNFLDIYEHADASLRPRLQILWDATGLPSLEEVMSKLAPSSESKPAEDTASQPEPGAQGGTAMPF